MRRSPRFPPYPTKPHSSGQARICVNGHTHYLGKYDSPQSHAEHQRLYTEWRAGRLGRPATTARKAVTIEDIVARFFVEARAGRYLDVEGQPKAELQNYRHSFGPLLALHGTTPAIDFDARALVVVRDAMASGMWMSAKQKARAAKSKRKIGWSRSVCNRSLVRIKTFAKWAERSGFLPEGRHHHLCTVPGFESGSFGVRETDDVPPVPEEVIEATLAKCNPVVRSLLQVLLHTGARPSEIRTLRGQDINTSGRVEIAKGYWVTLPGVWTVHLRRHKTAYLRRRRIILFPKPAQEALAWLLAERGQEDYLFSPRHAMEMRRVERRAARKSKVQPSQVDRSKPGAKRRPGEFYKQTHLARSVTYACRAAGVPPWHPYQLRHNAAVNLIANYGWEIARIALGHSTEEMTRRYGHDDLRKVAAAFAQGSRDSA